MFTAALLGMALYQSARQVQFTYESKVALESVCIVGEFNEWDRARFLLTPNPSRTKWLGTFPIEPGVYNYLVCEENKRWLPDPEKPLVRDTNGNPLSRLVVLPADFENHSGRLGDGDVTATAFLHRPGPEDTARLSANRFYVRLRTRKDDIQSVAVKMGRRQRKLTIARTDELYDFWQGEFNATASDTPYSFVIRDGRSTYPYPADGSKFRQTLSAYSLPSPPAWVRGAVFYQIFPDRFENGDATNDGPGVQPWGATPTQTNRMGGDLKGIENRLQYLKDLGVNAIYLNPIFRSISNHGYDTIDYLSIDPRFGSITDLKHLVKSAHELGVRVILDAVFNHSSPEFFAFSDLVANGEGSRYRNWYFPTAFPIKVQEGQKTYRTFAGVPTMPKLNTDNVETADFLVRVGEYWIRECDIDGWRLDVADEVSQNFWRKFRSAIKQVKPDAYILGEVWGDAHVYLQGDQHDGVMNYRWRRLVLEWLSDPASTNVTLLTGLRLIDNDYPEAARSVTFNILSSHDTERLITRFKGDESNFRIATALQFFLGGVPCIYYGEEVGMEGGHDPLCRGAMPWDQSKWNHERLEWYRSLIKFRKSRGADGKLRDLGSAEMLQLEWRAEKGWTRLYVNRTAQDQSASLPRGGFLQTGYRSRTKGDRLTVESGGVALVGDRESLSADR